MRTAPIKPQYGPTLPQLLAPRLRSSGGLRRGLAALVLALVALVAAIVVLTWPSSVSHGGPVPFSFQYADHLHRVGSSGGEIARIEARSRGLLVASLSVSAVRLPPYGGDLEGELPLYADQLIGRLATADPSFALELEGKIRDNDAPGYTIDYSARRNGRPVFGRLVLLFPSHGNPRRGLMLTMLERPGVAVSTPDRIGVVGDLKLPFTTFQTG